MIACVIYAAKSTEDRHGSIPDQLRDCRAAIETAGERRILAEYADEAVLAPARVQPHRGPDTGGKRSHVRDAA